MMACQADVTKHMLHQPILSKRIGEWAYVLIDCDLAFELLSIFERSNPRQFYSWARN
jgi:hypothetical protein